jgi:hypothetical protein
MSTTITAEIADPSAPQIAARTAWGHRIRPSGRRRPSRPGTRSSPAGTRRRRSQSRKSAAAQVDQPVPVVGSVPVQTAERLAPPDSRSGPWSLSFHRHAAAGAIRLSALAEVAPLDAEAVDGIECLLGLREPVPVVRLAVEARLAHRNEPAAFELEDGRGRLSHALAQRVGVVHAANNSIELSGKSSAIPVDRRPYYW